MPQLLKTPVAECEWFKCLAEARENKFDPSKPPTWSLDLVLDNSNVDHMAWIEQMEAKYTELHGDKKKSNHWMPCAPHKEEPRKKTVVRFKLPEFQRKDGTSSAGPVVFDSALRPWDHKNLVGNGSKIVVAFDIYAWGGSTGAGMTFQPRQIQIVDYKPYVADAENVTPAFDVVPGGYVDDAVVFDATPGLTSED